MQDGERKNLIDAVDGYGDRALEIERVWIGNATGTDTAAFQTGEEMRLVMRARARATIEKPNLGYALYGTDGLVFSVSALNAGVSLASMKSGDVVDVEFSLAVDLKAGSYSVTVLAADNHDSASPDTGRHHDAREGLGPILVSEPAGGMPFGGIARIPARILMFTTVDGFVRNEGRAANV